MKIAILGGTGRIGEGLASRWAHAHDIYIGSRDVEKAKNAACAYSCRLTESLTSFLINMAKRNGLSDLRVKFV